MVSLRKKRAIDAVEEFVDMKKKKKMVEKTKKKTVEETKKWKRKSNASSAVSEKVSKIAVFSDAKKRKRGESPKAETKSAEKNRGLLLRSRRNKKVRVGRGATAIKLSHIPYGFFEFEMLSYFRQFGNVLRIRLPRKKTTGNMRGYAYILFDDASVAQIVAEAMDGYLMYDERMTCKVLPQLPKCLQNGPLIYLPPIPEVELKKISTRFNRITTAEQKRQQCAHVVERLIKNNEKLNQLGINYRFPIPSLPDSMAMTEEEYMAVEGELKQEEEKKIEDSKANVIADILAENDEPISSTPKEKRKRKATERYFNAK